MLVRRHAIPPRPDCVLLDLDNTLYPYAPAHAAGMRALRAKAQSALAVAPADFDAAYERGRQQVKHRLGRTAASHSRLLYLQQALEGLGFGGHISHVLDLEQTYWRAYLAASILHDGAMAFLEDLRLARIPVAVVTDFTARLQIRKMVFLRIDTMFDALVSSEEVGADKPDPLMFTTALAKLGMPGTGTVWAMGDDVERDCAGAKAACGAITFHWGGKACPADGIDYGISGWGEMSALLQAALSGLRETSLPAAAPAALAS